MAKQKARRSRKHAGRKALPPATGEAAVAAEVVTEGAASTAVARAPLADEGGELIRPDGAAFGLRPLTHGRTPPPEPALGTLALRPEIASQLTAPITDEQTDILPTGEVYLAQNEYRRRLTAAFGPGGWTLKPVGDPIQTDDGSEGAGALAQRFEFYALGHYVATAFGEADYYPENPRMTWATAWESAKSNAVMRVCKDLGIASECWDRRWTDQFRARACVRVWRKGESKPQWRRLDSPPWFDETGPTTDSPNREKWQGPPTSGGRGDSGRPSGSGTKHDTGAPRSGPPVINDGQINRLMLKIRERAKAEGVTPRALGEAVKAFMVERFKINEAEKITVASYDEICAFVDGWKNTPASSDQSPTADEIFGGPPPGDGERVPGQEG